MRSQDHKIPPAKFGSTFGEMEIREGEYNGNGGKPKMESYRYESESSEDENPNHLVSSTDSSSDGEEGAKTEESSEEEWGTEETDPLPIARIQQIKLSSPMCHIQLEDGSKVKTLLDSGADVSCLQEKWAKRLQNGGSIIKWDKGRDQRECHNATGQIMDTRGTVYLKFRIGGKSFTHPFLVIKQLSQPLILGNDFMTHSHMKLDFKHRTADLQGTLIKLESKGSDSPGYFFTRVREDTTIAPFGQSKVPCKAEGEAPVGWHHISMLDVGDLGALPMIAISGGVVELGPKRMHAAWATNSSNEPITLRQGVVIATLTPQEEEEINRVEIQNNLPKSRKDLSWLKTEGLPTHVKRGLSEVIWKYSALFVSKETELGRTPWATCTLETDNEIPVQGKMYGTPLALRHVLIQKLNELKDANLIRESNSDWTSSLLLVKKGDGGYRVCIDYRMLNKKLKRNPYPMRKIFDMIPHLQGMKYFSKLDALSGFFQIGIEESIQRNKVRATVGSANIFS